MLWAIMAGCTRETATIRSYREVASKREQAHAISGATMDTAASPAAPSNAMADTPVPTAGAGLAWTTPEGWVASPGGQMRLATFRIGAGECTVTAFPGDVGGLEANLKRWLGQLNVAAEDATVSAFARAPLTFHSEGGLPCLVFDFAALLPPDPPLSLLACVVPMEGQTAFLKFTGPPALLDAEREHFHALCRSLRP